MNTIKIPEKGHTQFIAHRGLSGIERENTNLAFVAAGNRSYYGIETDVYHTPDKRFILLHDGTTGRVAKEDLAVWEHNFDRLRQVCLTDRDGSCDRIDIRMPSVEEYFGICRKYDKISVLELKSRFPKEEIAQMLQMAKDLGQYENLIIISFNLDNLTRTREVDPDIRIQYLLDHWDDGAMGVMKMYGLDLDIHYGSLTESRIADCHDNGIKVNCWTVDDPEAAKNLIGWGVDYITTNILE